MTVREDTYFLAHTEAHLGSWKDIYDMPTQLRRWFVERHRQQLEAEKKHFEEEAKKSKARRR